MKYFIYSFSTFHVTFQKSLQSFWRFTDVYYIFFYFEEYQFASEASGFLLHMDAVTTVHEKANYIK